MENARANGVDFRGRDLSDSSFDGADLGGAQLEGAGGPTDQLRPRRSHQRPHAPDDGAGCQFQGRSPRPRRHAGGALRRGLFPGCQFGASARREGHLHPGAQCGKAKLRAASLQDASFRYADLSHTDLRGADLRNADLEQANVHRALREGTNLRGARLTHLQDTDPQRAAAEDFTPGRPA